MLFILFYFNFHKPTADCGDQLRYFLSWTNRKAGSSILHMPTAKQLKQQETVVGRQRKLLIYDENVCGVFVKRQLNTVSFPNL
jgi:hypothetical protein